MTTTNKWLLISESRSDSNWCTPCRGKPDQHATCFSRSVRVWSKTICISHGPHIATLRKVVNRVKHGHCSWEKGLPTQFTSHRLTDPRVCIYFFSRANQWSSGGKVKHLLTMATKLTGPISPTCDWYIQYFLVGANPSVLNQHRRGLQPWRCRLATYHSLIFPTSCLHFLLRAQPGLQYNHVPTTKPKCLV
jgi:hypothetical protein